MRSAPRRRASSPSQTIIWRPYPPRRWSAFTATPRAGPSSDRTRRPTACRAGFSVDTALGPRPGAWSAELARWLVSAAGFATYRSPMRVLHVVRRFDPLVGGTERYVGDLARAQAAA